MLLRGGQLSGGVPNIYIEFHVYPQLQLRPLLSPRWSLDTRALPSRTHKINRGIYLFQFVVLFRGIGIPEVARTRKKKREEIRNILNYFQLEKRQSWDGFGGERARLPQYGPGSIPVRCHMWVKFVVGSRPFSEGFYRSGTCTSGFLPS